MITLTGAALCTYITEAIKNWEQALFGVSTELNKTQVNILNTSPKGVTVFLSVKDGIFGHTRRIKINQKNRTTTVTINNIDSDSVQYLAHPAIQLRENEPFNIEKLNIPAIALNDKAKCDQLKNELITIVTVWAVNDVVKYRYYQRFSDKGVDVPVTNILQSTRILDVLQSCFYTAQSFGSCKFKNDPAGYSKVKKIANIGIYGSGSTQLPDRYELWFNTVFYKQDGGYEPDNIESEFITHVKVINNDLDRLHHGKMDTMLVMSAMLLKFREHNWVFELTR